MWEPSNKGMKLTKPEHIGALQLIPGVRPTTRGAARGDQPGRGSGASSLSGLTEWAATPPKVGRSQVALRVAGADGP